MKNQSENVWLCPKCAGELPIDAAGLCIHCGHLILNRPEQFIKQFQLDKYGNTKADLDKLFKLNIQFINEGKNEEASFITSRIIRHSNDVDMLYQLGKTYSEVRSYPLAASVFTKAIELSPNNGMYHYELAQAYYNAGQYSKVIPPALKSIEIEPNNVKSYALLANTYSVIGDFTKSAQNYLYAIALDKNVIEYQVGFMDAVNSGASAVEIQKTFESLIPSNKDNEQLYSQMAKFYSTIGKYYNAIRLMKKAIELAPSNLQMKIGLANIYRSQGEMESALETYKDILKADNSNYDALYGIGTIYMYHQGKYKDALEYFEKLQQKHPEAYSLYVDRAMAHRKLGEIMKAISLLEKVLTEHSPAWERPMVELLSIYYYDMQDYQKVIKTVEARLKDFQNSALVYEYYAWALLMFPDRYQDSKRAFEISISLNPKSFSSLTGLGRLLNLMGNYDDAIPVLLQSININPNYVPPYEHLVDSYRALNKNQLALKTANDGLAIDPTNQFLQIVVKELTVDDSVTDIYKKPATEAQTEEGEQAGEVHLPDFAFDLTEQAMQGKLDDIIGRESELEELIEVLCRRNKPNPLLVGEAGVGKTAIVQGLAHKIAKNDVPEQLKGYKVIEVAVFAVVSGTKWVGTLEKKFQSLIDYCKNIKCILFIDEVHTLIGAGSTSSHETGGLDQMFKPMMTNSAFKLIGATTEDEYRKHIVKDSALERRFTKITVREPSKEDTLKIMQHVKPKLEKFHNITIPDALLPRILDMSSRYIKDRNQPDKALDLMERATIKASLRRQWKKDDSVDDGVKCTVTDTDVIKAVSQMARIPMNNIHSDSMREILNLEEKLKKRIIGQDEAISKVVDIIRLTKSDFDVNPNRPDGVFLFLGPTGVGKTEMAKALAYVFEGDESKLVRIDMSEFHDQYEVSKLIGSPPGYVGYEEEGKLTGAIKKNPSAIILFDEIEKAHPRVYDLFLQIFDDGRLTDGKGITVDFSHTTIIMTSNIGSDIFSKSTTIGFHTQADEASRKDIKSKVKDELKRFFLPEFLNRLDEIIIFNPLSKDSLKQIAKIKLKDVQSRFARRDIHITISEEAIDLIVESIESEKMGARNLNRAIEENISKPLSKLYLQTPESKLYEVIVENNKVAVLRVAREKEK